MSSVVCDSIFQEEINLVCMSSSNTYKSMYNYRLQMGIMEGDACKCNEDKSEL